MSRVSRWSALSVSLILGGVSVAQPPVPVQRPPLNAGAVPVAGAPAAVPAAAPVSPALEAHLKAWETRSAGVQTMYTECEMVRKDLVRRRELNYTGSIACMKPSLARMRMDNKATKGDYLAYICDGSYVYEYSGLDKTVTQIRIPPGGKGGVGDNLLIEFMSGNLTAADVKARFEVSLAKEEEFYVHLQIVPRFAKDKQDFDSMLLVLFGPGAREMAYLPAIVVMKKNNGQEIEQWTFKKPIANAQGIKREDFQYVKPAADWQIKAAGAANAAPTNPKVARPSGP